jgi:hypothetical protein
MLKKVQIQKISNVSLRMAFLALLAFVVCWFCLVSSSAVRHSAQMTDTKGSCASCHTDGQTSVALKIEEEKYELEPTPPPFWMSVRVPLEIHYSYILVIFLGFLILHRKIHLTTQMRF